MLTRLKVLIRLAQVLQWKPPDGISVGFLVLSDLEVHIVVRHGAAQGVLIFRPDAPLCRCLPRWLDTCAKLLLTQSVVRGGDDAGIAERLAEAEVAFERGMRSVSPEGRP